MAPQDNLLLDIAIFLGIGAGWVHGKLDLGEVREDTRQEPFSNFWSFPN